jgi:septum site-determining protein MinC
MAVKRNMVTIKGVKDGLVFLLDDACHYDVLVAELKQKLDRKKNNMWSGPKVNVQVKLGNRVVSENQKEEIRRIIRQHDNLVIQTLESDAPSPEEREDGKERIPVLRGVVRSGQTLQHKGNLLFIGDVNPGGTIVCTGDLFVMGSLRGVAHAGSEGNMEAVIAASHLKPTQLRIADIVSRPPDEWGFSEAYMEFAYIREGKMEIDKLGQLQRFHRLLAK